MRHLIILLVLAGLALSACIDTSSNSPFFELEEQVESNPTNANVSQLLTEYADWLRENREVSALRKDILLKSYQVSDRHIRLNNKLQALQMLIVDYSNDPATMERLVELSDLYDKLRRPSAGLVLNQEIASRYSSADGLDAIRNKIPAGTPPAREIIEGLAQAMFDTTSLRLDQPVARQYVDACEAYAAVNNTDTYSADLLHKAAETARTLGTLNRAIGLYDWILVNYPDHPRASQSLFLKAFTYDSNLGDYEKAKVYYEEFLEKYPEDDFASSAQFLLENIGKDDDELLKILQEKAEENDDPTN